MGRRRKVLDFPALPVPLVDAMLRAEEEIRRTVKEERQAFSFIGVRDPAGGRSGRGGKTDKTAEAALKLTKELPAVVLDDGRTVRRPESWLAIFDEVRKRAGNLKPYGGIDQREIVFIEWRTTYKREIFFVPSLPDLPTLCRQARHWIRAEVLGLARKAGLVECTEEEAEKGLKAANESLWGEFEDE